MWFCWLVYFFFFTSFAFWLLAYLLCYQHFMLALLFSYPVCECLSMPRLLRLLILSYKIMCRLKQKISVFSSFIILSSPVLAVTVVVFGWMKKKIENIESTMSHLKQNHQLSMTGMFCYYMFHVSLFFVSPTTNISSQTTHICAQGTQHFKLHANHINITQQYHQNWTLEHRTTKRLIYRQIIFLLRIILNVERFWTGPVQCYKCSNCHSSPFYLVTLFFLSFLLLLVNN